MEGDVFHCDQGMGGTQSNYSTRYRSAYDRNKYEDRCKDDFVIVGSYDRTFSYSGVVANRGIGSTTSPSTIMMNENASPLGFAISVRRIIVDSIYPSLKHALSHTHLLIH